MMEDEDGWLIITKDASNEISETKELRQEARVTTQAVTHSVANWKDFLDACRNGHYESVKQELAKNPPMLNLGFSYACQYQFRPIMKLLLDHGAVTCINCRCSSTKDHFRAEELV